MADFQMLTTRNFIGNQVKIITKLSNFKLVIDNLSTNCLFLVLCLLLTTNSTYLKNISSEFKNCLINPSGSICTWEE
jgi:hypothetical protein